MRVVLDQECTTACAKALNNNPFIAERSMPHAILKGDQGSRTGYELCYARVVKHNVWRVPRVLESFVAVFLGLLLSLFYLSAVTQISSHTCSRAEFGEFAKSLRLGIGKGHTIFFIL